MNEPRPIPIPPGLSEADLLAWVEGEPQQRDVAAAVARALDADPGLARVLGGMRSDRAALRSMPDEAAPEGLLELAQSLLEPALERRLLLGLESSAPAQGGVPVSIVRPARRSVLSVMFADRVGRRFAAAAALLLLAGGGTWRTTSVLTRSPAPTPTTRIADADMVRPEAIAEFSPEKAAEQAEPDDFVGPPAPATVLAQGPTETTAGVVSITSGPADGSDPEAMSVARALELASENRLVIVVEGQDFAQASARVQSLASRARPEAAWRVHADAPIAVIAALTPRPRAVPVLTRGAESPEFAARSAAEIGPPPPTPTLPVPRLEASPAQREFYVLESRLEEATLEAVLATLREEGASARFAEAEEPLPAPLPTLSAQALLWWTQPPSCWAPWGSIPVVVQQK